MKTIWTLMGLSLAKLAMNFKYGPKCKKNNDRNGRKREEMKDKLEAIRKEIRSNKSSSTVTNPRSGTDEM